MYVDDLLHLEDFTNFTKNELLEFILMLRTDLKHHKYIKENNQNLIQSNISNLVQQIDQLTKELDKLKEANQNFRTLFIRDLTIKERITGKINLNLKK